MIETRGLTKRYGAFTALEGLDLTIPEGELFVLLGPNGAGKTTTLKLLATLLRPSAGTALVGGYDVTREPNAVKDVLGYVPDTPVLYDKLTGSEFLAFIADIRGIRERERIFRFLHTFELADAANALIETYSLGMKKKVALASALMHRPRVLLLDEPTGGLDPHSSRFVKDLLPQLCGQGLTVLMTTHVLEIAERMCHRVGIIHKGRLQACGTLGELRAEYGDLSLEDLFLKITGVRSEAPPADFWDDRR